MKESSDADHIDYKERDVQLRQYYFPDEIDGITVESGDGFVRLIWGELTFWLNTELEDYEPTMVRFNTMVDEMKRLKSILSTNLARSLNARATI